MSSMFTASLFEGPACSTFFAAYEIDSSRGEMSGLLVRSVSALDKARGTLKLKSDILNTV